MQSPPARRLGKSLTKRASLNALAEALEYGTRLAVGFVVKPLLVAGLGPYFFGVWQILGRLTGYVLTADGRPTQALKWSIARQQTSTDFQQKRRYVGSAVAVWLLFLPLLAVLGGVLAWFAPSWLKIPIESCAAVRVTAGLLVANAVLTSLIGIPRAILRGENLGYKRMGLSAMVVCVGGGLTVLALYWNTGLVGVAAAATITTLLGGILFWFVCRTHVPWFGIALPSMAEVRRFCGLSGWFLTWRLVHQAMLTSDILLLGMLASVQLVSVYTLSKYTPEVLVTATAILAGGATPGLGGILGSGNLTKAARVRSELIAMTWLVTTVMGATVLLWNESFACLWVGPEFYVGTTANLLIILTIVQFVLLRCDAQIIDLTLNLRHKVLIGAASAAVSVLAAAVVLGVFDGGVAGLCLAFLAGRSILTVCYPWMVGRFLGIAGYTQLKGLLRPTATTALLFLLMLLLSQVVTIRSWTGLVLAVSTTMTTVGLFTFWVGLTSGQRRQVLQRIRG